MANLKRRLELFCDDLFVYILSKLPGKDLIQCKCVSKEWHRIITHVCVPLLSIKAPVSGVYFRLARLTGIVEQVSTESPPDVLEKLYNHMAYDGSVHIIRIAPLKLHYNLLDDNSGFRGTSYARILPFKHHGPDFLDCCNGLLLFVHRPKPQFHVCNPAIKQCVPIPLPPPTVHLHSLYASLAFDPSESIHFRIVISLLTTQPQCLLIFYSETGEWMTHEIQVKLPEPVESFRLVRHCVYFKGMLYRLSLSNIILCFDLNAKTTRTFACPNKVKHKLPRGCFGVLAGSLSYAKSECRHMWLWLLDTQSDRGEWILKYKIPSMHIFYHASKKSSLCLGIWIHPYAFHPKSNILFVGSASKLFMYHLDSDHMEQVQQNERNTYHCGSLFSMFTYTRTLITLKDWCRIPSKPGEIDKNFEEVQDDWCFTEK